MVAIARQGYDASCMFRYLGDFQLPFLNWTAIPAVKSRFDVQAHVTCRLPAACEQGKLSTAPLLLNSPSLPETGYRTKLL